jgi:glyoxylase-like metal-dependent hydrolase (beta-lactamase superfamily II)
VVEILGEVAPGVYCLGPWGRFQTNVYLVRSGTSWVLIDAGWASDAVRIERAVRSLLGTGQRPEAILLTHCHPDHSGSAGALARRWGCPVWLHPDELPIATGDFAAMQACAHPLDRWIVLPLMRAMGSRRREAQLARGSLADVARTFTPGTDLPGLPDWDCVPTPGHTPGHVSYLRRHDRVLVSGDALFTLQIETVRGLLLPRPGLSGPPWYTTWDRRTAVASVAALLRLEPSVIAGGHGTPLAGVTAAAALRERRLPGAAREGDGGSG